MAKFETTMFSPAEHPYYYGVRPDEIAEHMRPVYAVRTYYRLANDATLYMEPLEGDPCKWNGRYWETLPYAD